MPTPDSAVRFHRIRAFLQESGHGGLLLGSPGNFAWATGGGRNHVSLSGDTGVGAVLVTPDRAYLLANNIELDRLAEEECAGVELEPVGFSWWSGSLAAEAERLVPAGLVSDLPGCGKPLSTEEGIALRNPLLPEELERYRRLGEDVGVILTHAAFHCRPGLSERQLAGMIAGRCVDLGMDPLVTLAAVDGRIALRRHPLPTDRRLERCALLVLTARRHGLHVSASRTVHFGPVPEELTARHAACARVDAALIAATRPGARLGEVFQAGARAYAEAGFPDEWQHHHQGGPTGYAPRDLKVTADTSATVLEGQTYAWNPTIAGTKSEDTILVTAEGSEVLSLTPDLPVISVQAAGRSWERPGILRR